MGRSSTSTSQSRNWPPSVPSHRIQSLPVRTRLRLARYINRVGRGTGWEEDIPSYEASRFILNRSFLFVNVPQPDRDPGSVSLSALLEYWFVDYPVRGGRLLSVVIEVIIRVVALGYLAAFWLQSSKVGPSTASLVGKACSLRRSNHLPSWNMQLSMLCTSTSVLAPISTEHIYSRSPLEPWPERTALSKQINDRTVSRKFHRKWQRFRTIFILC